MARNYVHTLFSDAARAAQAADGSREAYARMEEGADGSADLLTPREEEFIAGRDSFYLASVTPDGWPYVQHRGGPPGFLKVLDGNRLGFADYRGNRQHVTTTNLASDPRCSLFLVDYPNRRRLKVLGRASVVGAGKDPALLAALMPEGFRALGERAYIFDVVGFDWNCPQHITPRFTEQEVTASLRPLIDENTRLRAEVDQMRAKFEQQSEGA